MFNKNWRLQIDRKIQCLHQGIELLLLNDRQLADTGEKLEKKVNALIEYLDIEWQDKKVDVKNGKYVKRKKKSTKRK